MQSVHVDVPRSVVNIFTVRPSGKPVRAPLAKAAEVLGFKDADQLRSTVVQWWTGWQEEDSVSAADLVALIHLLQFRTAAARRLVKDLMLGGVCRVVAMPSEVVRGLPEGDSTERPDEEMVASPARKEQELRAEITPSKNSEIASDLPARQESTRELSARLRQLPWDACDPEDVGMDREPLEKCRQYLNYRVSRKHFAGIVQGVVKNGKLVHFDEVGFADLATKTPMRQDTLIRLFSMTKCIVVVAFLSYAEDPSNNIDLDDPVWKYIPSFKKAVIAPKRGSEKPRQIESKFFEVKSREDGKVKKVKLPTQPTLRQLLTHSAGLGYGPTLGDSIPPTDKDHYKIYFDLIQKSQKGQIRNIEEFVDELAKVPLKVHPGSYWEYSFCTDVLGRVVEVISGKSLDQAVEERVCGPLGMVDTCFKVPAEKAHRIGPWYERKPPVDADGKPLEKVQPGATHRLEEVDKAGVESGWYGNNTSRILSGGGTIELPLSIKGGMISTFRDYLRFCLMIRNFGELEGVRVLRRETVQTMLCNQLPTSTGRRAAWVFDKKGQGYNFIGQIQVQHNEKDTFQEKGELKRGNNTYASLAPGTVSSEFGWGGLGGPAFTIDPRADLIVLSMTQTALELDHEENLRFSARRAIHAGIFGETAGPMKVTDYPPEFHEAKKMGKLRPKPAEQSRKEPFVTVKAYTEAELATFMEAEEQGSLRSKTLKECAIGRGNFGHEVEDGDDDDISAEDAVANAVAVGQSDRELRHTPSSSSDKVKKHSPTQKRDKPEDDGDAPEVDRKAKLAKIASSPDAKQGDVLFARVSVRAAKENGAEVRKARVTGIENDKLEVVTEGKFQTLSVGLNDVSFIDETQFIPSTAKDALKGPSDFSFLMPKKVDDKQTPKK